MDLIPRIEVILITHRNFLSVFVLGRSLRRFSDGKMLTKFVPVCLNFAYGIFSALILNSNFLTRYIHSQFYIV